VRLEPITVTRWEPTDWSLEIIGPAGETKALECFPVPFSAPVDGFEAEVAAFEQSSRAAVRDKASLRTEELGRSMILAPDAFGEQPPTDGAFYHREGVPLMNFLTAPFYLFDAMDTLDKIDREHLVPLTRAAIRIVESTRGVSAAEMRAGVVTP
jgi:hypothetical protein